MLAMFEDYYRIDLTGKIWYVDIKNGLYIDSGKGESLYVQHYSSMYIAKVAFRLIDEAYHWKRYRVNLKESNVLDVIKRETINYYASMRNFTYNFRKYKKAWKISKRYWKDTVLSNIEDANNCALRLQDATKINRTGKLLRKVKK